MALQFCLLICSMTLVTWTSVAGMMCYHCNSHVEPKCKENNLTTLQEFLINCSSLDVPVTNETEGNLTTTSAASVGTATNGPMERAEPEGGTENGNVTAVTVFQGTPGAEIEDRYISCRLYYQWIEVNMLKMDKHMRVFRTCGRVKTDEDVLIRAGFGSRIQVYTCYTDGCNEAAFLVKQKHNAGLLLLLLGIAAVWNILNA